MSDEKEPLRCNQCRRIIGAFETFYRLVPEQHMRKAEAGKITPWAIILCSTCHGEKR